MNITDKKSSCNEAIGIGQGFRFDLRGYFFALIVSASFVMVRREECI